MHRELDESGNTSQKPLVRLRCATLAWRLLSCPPLVSRNTGRHLAAEKIFSHGVYNIGLCLYNYRAQEGVHVSSTYHAVIQAYIHAQHQGRMICEPIGTECKESEGRKDVRYSG